jgi:hypothetical protein
LLAANSRKDGVELWLKECAKCGKEFYSEAPGNKCERWRRKTKALNIWEA